MALVMANPKYEKVHSHSEEVNRIQDKVQKSSVNTSQFGQTVGQGQELKDIEFNGASPVDVPHGLGKAITGAVPIRSSDGTINFTIEPSPIDPVRFVRITPTAAGPVTVSFMVF